jgi:KaiC/GvpD/RAD55 family RecA-like ATPase
MVSFIKKLLTAKRKRSDVPFRIKTESLLNLKDGEVAIMTYTPAADKMKVFSAYIREGIERGDRIQYIYSDEDSETVRARLKEYGVDVKKHERNGTLYMKSLTEYYLPDGYFDKDRAIEKGLNLRAEAKRKGYKHVRELFDVGDFSFLNGQWQKYLEYWDDPRWGAPPGVGILYDPFITELTVFNVGGMSEAQVTEILKAFGGGKYPATRFIDVFEYADAFSKRIGISHQRVVGRKFLLEFDPVSSYEMVVRDFAREAMANLEPIFVFTSSTSAVYSSLAEQHSINLFLMSISASTLESISENKMVLPANNTALILGSFNRILETYAEKKVFLVFDNLSRLIELVGFDKTYKFLLYMVDMLSSERTTALFLLNKKAHEPQVVSRVRGVFHDILTYDKDGLKVVKSSSNL